MTFFGWKHLVLAVGWLLAFGMTLVVERVLRSYVSRQMIETYYAEFNAEDVAIVAAVFAAFALLCLWFPRLTGYEYDMRLGWAQLVSAYLAINLAAFTPIAWLHAKNSQSGLDAVTYLGFGANAVGALSLAIFLFLIWDAFHRKRPFSQRG